MGANTRIRRVLVGAALAAATVVGATAGPGTASAVLPADSIDDFGWLGDGDLIQRGSSERVAMLLDGARVDFADRDAAESAGCGDDVTVVPEAVFDSLPDEPDPLYAAIDHDVRVDDITPDPDYREDCLPVYRADGRGPQTIFAEGFAAKDVDHGQYNVRDYVLRNDASPFVSTTYRDDLYRTWGSPYYYRIDAPGGIDVNGTIGDDHIYASEEEVAFPGGIESRFIAEGCPVDRQTFEIIESQCQANPNFKAWDA